MPSLQSHRRSLPRLLPVLALGALTMLLHPATVSIGAGTGRDYARCIVECNSARRECRGACRSSCGDIFGPGQARRVCNRTCGAECDMVRQECRMECSTIKPPPTPTVP